MYDFFEMAFALLRRQCICTHYCNECLFFYLSHNTYGVFIGYEK